MQAENKKSYSSKSELKLINALIGAGLDGHLTVSLPVALEKNEEYMETIVGYINWKMETGAEVTENDVVRASLILRGLIEVEEE